MYRARIPCYAPAKHCYHGYISMLTLALSTKHRCDKVQPQRAASCRLLLGHRIQEENLDCHVFLASHEVFIKDFLSMKGNQTPQTLMLFFFARSQQQGLERMMIGVSLASNEYGTGQEPQLRLCGAWMAALNGTPVAPGRFVSERKLKVRRRATRQVVGVCPLSTVSQLACTGSRCRAAAGQHLGRASGRPLHI